MTFHPATHGACESFMSRRGDTGQPDDLCGRCSKPRADHPYAADVDVSTPRTIEVPDMPFLFGDGRFRVLYGPRASTGGRKIAGVIAEEYVEPLEAILEDDLGSHTKERDAMHFNFHKFLAIVAQVGPMVLLAVPGGEAIAPLIPVITHAITEAEQIKGATGAAKKAHVLEVTAAAVTTLNSLGKVTLDPAEVAQVTSAGVDAVIGTIHVIEGGKVVKAAA